MLYLKVAQRYLEARRKKVIIIDIQPAYQNAIFFNLYDFMEFLNTQAGEILMYYNGEDTLGMDSKYQMIDFYLDHGFNEDKLKDITWVDKGYGFFRNWMDAGIEDSDMIKAIRHLIMTRTWDSREVSSEEWAKIIPDAWEDYSREMKIDSINVPNLSVKSLRKFNGALVVGGGCNECLKEMRLLMSALNIRGTILRKFTY